MSPHSWSRRVRAAAAPLLHQAHASSLLPGTIRVRHHRAPGPHACPPPPSPHLARVSLLLPDPAHARCHRVLAPSRPSARTSMRTHRRLAVVPLPAPIRARGRHAPGPDMRPPPPTPSSSRIHREGVQPRSPFFSRHASTANDAHAAAHINATHPCRRRRLPLPELSARVYAG